MRRWTHFYRRQSAVSFCMKMKQVTDALLWYDSMNESLAERYDGFCTYATLCNSLFIPLVFD